ncbi:Ig-like domain-containing protein [Clostridium sp. JS66]|uniref:Ig-like domain-containing protein n=1 Tax=Clostridium sp. JS66 TaxID=3064705 RepID=UPI00298E55E6|nr:Ig-like domain-containing protein [Clostridium sp. JS66]WPC42977.1 Ig-like domain-containing protein [Clostridium sp. JS66]
MNKFGKKLSIIFVMAFAIMIGCFSNVFAADSTNYVPKKDYSSNLVAKWIFDDTNPNYIKGNIAKDLSGKGNDLTMNNITFQNDTDLGRCAYFNGTNAYAIANNSVFNANTSFSILVNIKVDDNKNFAPILVNDSNNYQSSLGTFLRIYDNGTIGFVCDYNTKTYGNDVSTSIPKLTKLKVLGVFNKDENKAKIFCNDLSHPANSGDTQIDSTMSDSNLCIGKSGNIYYKGYVQSIEIYNDVVEYESNPTAISLDKTSMNLPVGDTHDLVATVTPDNVINKKINWISDKPDIATVDENGKVTAIKEGIATITATIDGTNISTSCTVTVTPKGTTPTNPDNTGNAILTITMTNGNVKSYTVPMSKVNDFISWYDNRVSGSTGKAYYTFDKKDNLQPFSKKTEYIVFDKISSYEVDEYSK